MKTWYWIYYPKSHEHLNLFNDLRYKDDITLCNVAPRKIKNPIIRKIQKIYLSFTLNKIIQLPMKKKWYKYTRIENNENDKYKIVIMDGALVGLEDKYIHSLSKMKNVELVLVLINSISAESNSMVEIKGLLRNYKWDSIWTFDIEDAKKYGYNYLGTTYYSKINLNTPVNNSILFDTFLLAGLKGNRTHQIIDLFSYLENNGCNNKFQIMISGRHKLKKLPFINSIEYFSGGWIPYKESLEIMWKSNCIVEILQEGQNAQSLRYFEAICYNKKLLTNNKNIVNLPFYDSRYMKIFDKVENIDTNWIRKIENIDYGYSDEFSPKYMLNKIFSREVD